MIPSPMIVWLEGVRRRWRLVRRRRWEVDGMTDR